MVSYSSSRSECCVGIQHGLLLAVRISSIVRRASKTAHRRRFLCCRFVCVLRRCVKPVKMATNTMDAIKKKMQAMKGEKDNALEKADQLEQRVSEQKAINEKVLSGLVMSCFAVYQYHLYFTN